MVLLLMATDQFPRFVADSRLPLLFSNALPTHVSFRCYLQLQEFDHTQLPWMAHSYGSWPDGLLCLLAQCQLCGHTATQLALEKGQFSGTTWLLSQISAPIGNHLRHGLSLQLSGTFKTTSMEYFINFPSCRQGREETLATHPDGKRTAHYCI